MAMRKMQTESGNKEAGNDEILCDLVISCFLFLQELLSKKLFFCLSVKILQ